MKFDVLRTSAGLATATLTALAPASCGKSEPAVVVPKSVRHSELVGRWDGERECGSPLPVIRLRDDYTYSVKDLPFQWDGPGPDSPVIRRSNDGKWHGVNKDPGLPPYLVLRFERAEGWEIKIFHFTVDKGNLRMNGSVEADGGDPYHFTCHYKRTSVDPEFAKRGDGGAVRPAPPSSTGSGGRAVLPVR